MGLKCSVLDTRHIIDTLNRRLMFSSRPEPAVRPSGCGPSLPSFLSRMLAASALILFAPLFIVIVLALLLHGEWQVIVKETLEERDEETRVRLVFNTRTRVSWIDVWNENGLTRQERLAYFLLHTRLYELPSLFQSAFGYHETEQSTSASISGFRWRSRSSCSIEHPRTNNGKDNKEP